jgi:hypothetical protein
LGFEFCVNEARPFEGADGLMARENTRKEVNHYPAEFFLLGVSRATKLSGRPVAVTQNSKPKTQNQKLSVARSRICFT